MKRFVPPTAVTYGLDAGNSALLKSAPLDEPQSPADAKMVIPLAAACLKTVLAKYASRMSLLVVISASGVPQLSEIVEPRFLFTA